MHLRSIRRPLLLSAALFTCFTLTTGPGTVVFDAGPQSANTLSSGPPEVYSYRDYSQIRDLLILTAASYPDIVALHDIGDSWEKTVGLSDRDILAVKISDRVHEDEDEPEFLLMALHHAREWPTSETAVEVILHLTSNYGSDPRVSWLVDNREIWIVPVVNPDGLDYALYVDDMWRKNRRDNLDGTFGVDLNRNYNGSENGDPLGAWGGAGSSHITSSIVYCGSAPFSEPETQAIRDLVRARDFEVAFDFHTYGGDVMWPWGYTWDTTPDDAYLVDIGQQLAALNGYDAAQSIDLYATTGDSIDWLYGGADIFPFLFEMGSREFHPDKSEDVLAIIYENIPPTLLGIELAGDRLQLQFDISHTPPSDSPPLETGFHVVADVTAYRGVDISALSVVYRSDGGMWSEEQMTRDGHNDTYAALIPTVPAGSQVEYYIRAADLGGVELSSPRYAPYEVHCFSVLALSDPPVARAGPDVVTPVHQETVFDGSGSSDDIGIVNYTWTFPGDVPVEKYGAAVTHVFPSCGSFEVVLTVRDADGQTDQDSVLVTVHDPDPPVVSAGSDIMTYPGAEVVFDSSGSNDNVAIVGWRWEFEHNGSVVVLDGPSPSFRFWTEGVYTVTLNVTDEAGNYATDTMTVTVCWSAIPEFGTGILVPVVALLCLFVLIRARRP